MFSNRHFFLKALLNVTLFYTCLAYKIVRPNTLLIQSCAENAGHVSTQVNNTICLT
jgi:hypothetical protein